MSNPTIPKNPKTRPRSRGFDNSLVSESEYT